MRVAPPELLNFTTTESAEDMENAVKRYGVEFSIETVKQGMATEEEAAAAKAAETETPKPSEGSEPAEAKPKAAETEAKPKADLEPVEQAEETDEQWSDADKAKHKKLLRRIDSITSKFKTEQTNSKAVKEEVAELRRQVAALGEKKPEVAAPPEPETPKRPTRPARPKLEQFEYDTAKYEAALDKHESETIPAYEDALSAYTRAETLREMQEHQERQAQEETLRQDAEEWQSAIDAKDGLREKIEAATDVMQSPAMQTVVQGMFDPAERAVIIEYLVDNPDEAARITGKTLGREGKGKTSQAEWSYLQNVATKEFTAILLEAKRAAKTDPEPVSPKPKAVASQSAPPAKPKQPVSAAPAPIDPVGARTGATVTRIDDPNIEHDAYRAARAQQLQERRKAQMGR